MFHWQGRLIVKDWPDSEHDRWGQSMSRRENRRKVFSASYRVAETVDVIKAMWWIYGEKERQKERKVFKKIYRHALTKRKYSSATQCAGLSRFPVEFVGNYLNDAQSVCLTVCATESSSPSLSLSLSASICSMVFSSKRAVASGSVPSADSC